MVGKAMAIDLSTKYIVKSIDLNKESLVTFCLIITIIPAFSIEDKVHEFPRTYLEFSIFESKMAIGKYLNSSKFDSLFEKYDYKEIPCKRTKKDKMLTLKSNVFIDSLYVGQHLFAVLMPVF